jgi:hypothetical protein
MTAIQLAGRDDQASKMEARAETIWAKNAEANPAT